MKKVLFYILCGFAILYFSACQQKMVCPAYHSYFILDVDETKKTFSLFGEDSLPKKTWEVDKEKYGIAKNIPTQKKLKEMRIISMNSVYKKLEDPMDMQHEIAGSDTEGYTDSTAVAAQQEENDFQNVDQMIYLHHFGKYLPKKGRPDDLLQEDLKSEESPMISDDGSEEPAPAKKKKKGGLFGKKKSKSADETTSEEEEEEE